MKKNKHISQSELESYLWGAATLLRGYIDAGDYKQFIFPLLFYKRLCDVYDEELADALDLPSALWSPVWALQRLDPQRSNGLCGDDPAFRVALRQQIDGWLARSTPGFPAYTLGL